MRKCFSPQFWTSNIDNSEQLKGRAVVLGRAIAPNLLRHSLEDLSPQEKWSRLEVWQKDRCPQEGLLQPLHQSKARHQDFLEQDWLRDKEKTGAS